MAGVNYLTYGQPNMEPQKGMFQANKTSMYLLPILKTYSDGFLKPFAELTGHLLCISIADVLYQRATDIKIPSFFFLFDKNGPYDINNHQYYNPEKYKQLFLNCLKKIRKQSCYVDDYIYGDLRGDTHCLVVKIPDKFINTYEAFFQSKYSEMYTEEQLKTLAIPKLRQNKPNRIYQVLVKDPEYVPEFQTLLNDIFGTNIVIDDDRELDLPINNLEILNA